MSGHVEHSWHAIDLADVALTPPSPPSIGGLVYPGRRHIWSGEPESLKTWAALVVAAAEIQAGGSVLWLDFEMEPREMVERLRALGLDDVGLARFLYVAPEEPIGTRGVQEALRALLAVSRPRLVVVDAFIGALVLHGLDPNSGADVERFNHAVVSVLRCEGAAVLILDHLPKNREGRGRFSIGSERKVGGTDVHLGFEIVQPFGRGRRGLVRIVVHKDRPGHLPRPRAADLELRSDLETHAITWDLRLGEQDQDEPDSFRPTALMQRVSVFLEQQAEPVSRNVLEAAVKGKRDYVRLAVDVLVREGYASEKPGPRKGRMLSSLKPFRDLAPTSPDFAPGEDSATSPHFAPLLTGGAKVRAQSNGQPEDTSSPPLGEDEIERLANLAREAGSTRERR